MRLPAFAQAYNQFDNDSMDSYSSPEDGSTLKGFDPTTQDIISYYLMGIATTSICCVGIVGNILSLIVLSKPTMRTGTTHMYLIALAISDTLVLIFTILTALKDTRSPYKWGGASWQAWLDVPFVAKSYPICHAFAILFQVNSVWLTVAFSADRYFVICHPFIAERFCSRMLANVIIFLLFLVCIGYNIPRFFEHEIIRFNFQGPNHTLLAFNDTLLMDLPVSILWYHVASFGGSKAFRLGYHFVSWMLFVVIAPFISLAVMNSFLIREVRRSYRRGRAINASERRRNDTNVMLISVIVLFFICQVPAAINHVLWGFITESTEPNIFRYLTNEIGNFLIILNSAINIMPYYLFGRKFRQELLGLFCSRQVMSDTKMVNISMNSLENHSVHHAKSRAAVQTTTFGSVDGRRLMKGRRSKNSSKSRRQKLSGEEPAGYIANGANNLARGSACSAAPSGVSLPASTSQISPSRGSSSPSISCEMREMPGPPEDNHRESRNVRQEVTVETFQ